MNCETIFVMFTTCSIIHLQTKNVYKQMLKNNSAAFDIRISEVDSFIDSIGEKIRKKYFY